MNEVYVIIHDEVDSPSEILGVFTDKTKAEKVLVFIKDLEGVNPYEDYEIREYDVNKIIMNV